MSQLLVPAFARHASVVLEQPEEGMATSSTQRLQEGVEMVSGLAIARRQVRTGSGKKLLDVMD